jgi:hypothetical protein
VKLLFLVYRDSLAELIQGQLTAMGVESYTRMDRTAGAGASGQAEATFPGMQDNTALWVVLSDERACSVVEKLRALRTTLADERLGAPLPFHLFVLPCEQAF